MRISHHWLWGVAVLAACQAQDSLSSADDTSELADTCAAPGSAPARLAIVDGTSNGGQTLNFADQDSAVVTVRNAGGAATRPLVLALAGDGRDEFAIDPASTCAGRALAPGETCTVAVQYLPASAALHTAALTIEDRRHDRVQVALAPVAAPRLSIRFAGGALGEVQVSDPATTQAIATCARSCVLRFAPGTQLEIDAVTPSINQGLSGACPLGALSCQLTTGNTPSTVTATFVPDPKEVWTVLPGGDTITSAVFDSAGNLITASGAITKLSPTGTVVWQVPVAACAVATGPGDTIYAETTARIMKLAPSGTTIWSQPLTREATGCGDLFSGFVHNLAVGSDGAAAVHGDGGVARWDSDGNLTWSLPVVSNAEYGVAIEPSGAVAVATTVDEPIDLARFAADGTPLDGVDHITSQYHGMFVIDAAGRLLATASGHSHTDALGHSVRLLDPDFAPTGICAAGDGAAWVYQLDDDSMFARNWIVQRYRGDGSLAWSHAQSIQRTREFGTFTDHGTIPFDIAGAPDGRIAIVGSHFGLAYAGGWIAMFQP